MALIPCPVCGKEISSSAVACPRCGYRPGIDPIPNAKTNEQGAEVISEAAVNLKQFEESLADITSDNSEHIPTLKLTDEESEPKVRVYANGGSEDEEAVTPHLTLETPITEAKDSTAVPPQPQQNSYAQNTAPAESQISTPPQNNGYSGPAQQTERKGYTQSYAAPKPKKKSPALAIIAAIAVIAIAAVYFMKPTTYNNLNQQDSYIKLTRLGSKYEQLIGSESDEEQINGTYLLDSGNLILKASDGEETEYVVDGKYIISNPYEIYSGAPNANSHFDCAITKEYSYTSDNGVDTYILFMYLFKSDGSCSYGLAIYYNDIKNYSSTSFGSYTINNGLINASYDSGDLSGETDCLYVYDSTIYTTVYSK